MPKLISLYIRQVITGFGLSAIFVGILLYYNVANLWHLVTHTDAGALAVVVLWVLNGIVFAGVQFGIAVMRMADDDTPKGGKRQPELIRAEARVTVEADKPRGALRFLTRR